MIQNTKNKFFVWMSLLVTLLLFLPFGLKAQQDIQEELFQRDSLINKIGKQNIDTSYIYQWNEDSSRWDLFGRDLEFYRENQKLLAVLEQRWQPDKLDFINNKRTIKSYGNKGQVVESLHQNWDSVRQEWVNLRLKTITYDARGNKSEILHQEWRRAVGRWVSTTRYLIEYNRMGEKSNIVIRSYNSGTDDWINYQRYLFRYNDGFGPPNEALVQNWNRATKQWEKQGLYSMRYNFRGQKTMESRATWNEGLSEWINGLRYRFSYQKKNKTGQILQRWDYSTKQWYNAEQKKFKYDEEDELKEELTFSWNDSIDQWELKNRLLYSQKKPEIPEQTSKDTSNSSSL